MLASELISNLQSIIADNGDVDITCYEFLSVDMAMAWSGKYPIKKIEKNNDGEWVISCE